MKTSVVVPREPFWTTSRPGTVRNTSATVSACCWRISSSVITVTEVEVSVSGVSVRVAVTTTGLSRGIGGGAWLDGAAPDCSSTPCPCWPRRAGGAQKKHATLRSDHQTLRMRVNPFLTRVGGRPASLQRQDGPQAKKTDSRKKTHPGR